MQNTKIEWLSHVGAIKSQAGSTAAYARQHNLVRATLYCIGTMSSCSLMSWLISTIGVPQGQVCSPGSTSWTTSTRVRAASRGRRLPRALVAGLLAWGAETSAGAMGAMPRAGVLVCARAFSLVKQAALGGQLLEAGAKQALTRQQGLLEHAHEVGLSLNGQGFLLDRLSLAVQVLHDGKVGVLLGHQERFEGGGLGGQNRR
jgi:hypothetical protein